VGAPEGVEPLISLADELGRLSFGLSGPSRRLLREQALGMRRLLHGLVARAGAPAAPLLVVVAGGTGAGKSTMVNSLAGTRVAATSVVRPTTRAPVLVCHPEDLSWFEDERLLGDLPRVTGRDDAAGVGRRLVLHTSAGLPPGLALLDTPDVDSVETANHRLAEEVLDVADVWIWATTARTYADEVGMTYLRRARLRQVLTAVVVTQVRAADRDEVLADVDRLLGAEQTVPDVRLHVPFVQIVDERVDDDSIASLRRWLTGLAPPGERTAIRRRALRGMSSAVPIELAPLLQAVEAEEATAARLRGALDQAYRPVHEQLATELDAGIPLRADVLDRWRVLVGAGDTLARVQTAAHRIRGMVRDLTGAAGDVPPGSPRQVRAEVADTLSDALTRILEQAAWHARRRFESDPIGRGLLDAVPDLRGGDHDRPRRVRREVDAWGDQVASMVATVGAERKVQARRWSTALNAVATSAILVVFTISGGLTGGEVGIAALASAASQALLVRMFGEQNLRRLLADARVHLDERVTDLVVADRRPYERAIDAAAPPIGTVVHLRRIVGEVRP
jgi:energy-coupling factor transporter ATP-binding protein EcfA2